MTRSSDQQFSKSLLIDRNNTHGEWKIQSRIHHNIIEILNSTPNYSDMSPPQKMALHGIAMKMSRIVCGDQHLKDHWLDIAGYANLGLGLIGENK